MCGHHIAVYNHNYYVACTEVLLLLSKQIITKHGGIFYA